MAEVKRVLKNHGKFILRTSGRNNKYLQRHAERFVASDLGLAPPELMNRRYNSQRAAVHLQHHFRKVVHVPLHRVFVFTAETLPVFMGSLSSMNDQYDPTIPRASQVEASYAAWKRKFVDPSLARTGRVIDLCERDLFIASEPIY